MPYLQLFGRAALKIVLYEDWKRDNLGVLRDLFAFLEVDADFVPDVSRTFNVSAVPRGTWIAPLMRRTRALRKSTAAPDPVLRRVARRMLLRHPVLDPEDRSGLVARYRDDVHRLEDLLGRDLSSWLSV